MNDDDHCIDVALTKGQQEIEAFFLDHDDPIVERIQEEDDEVLAVAIAAHALAAGWMPPWEPKDLVAVVHRLRCVR